MVSKDIRTQPPSATERIYIVLISLFLGVLLLTNIITSKYIQVANLTFTAGAITYPFTFSILDIISEIYGNNKAKIVIWMGLWVSIFMICITYLATLLPIHAYSPIPQTAFELIFGFTPGIVLGSMVAYLSAQFIDIYLFGLIRRLTNGKHLWLRNNISTIIGQLVDTTIFSSFAWIVWPYIGLHIQPISWNTWYQITLNEYSLKVLFSFLNIPFVYLSVYWIKKHIKI